MRPRRCKESSNLVLREGGTRDSLPGAPFGALVLLKAQQHVALDELEVNDTMEEQSFEHADNPIDQLDIFARFKQPREPCAHVRLPHSASFPGTELWQDVAVEH